MVRQTLDQEFWFLTHRLYQAARAAVEGAVRREVTFDEALRPDPPTSLSLPRRASDQTGQPDVSPSTAPEPRYIPSVEVGVCCGNRCSTSAIISFMTFSSA
jgi:hypothetical protein